ncbi:MAG: response regulator [Desulfatiglandales bacterium]
MSKKTKVLIVDDHSVVLEGIRKTLEWEPDFEVVGEARNGAEALNLAKSLQPDLIIIDIAMPGMNGIEACRRISEADEDIRFIVFSMFKDKEYIIPLFRTGISAYVLKDEPVSDLQQALRTVRAGGNFYSSQVRRVIQDHLIELERTKETGETENEVERLSNREKEIFPLLANGLSIKNIADRLFISPKTVETHKYNILQKLGLNSIVELTKIAIKRKLI